MKHGVNIMPLEAILTYFNSLHSVIIMWQTHKLVRWEQHYAT